MKKNKIKILFDYQVLSFQRYGGISRYFYELFTSLNEKHNEEIEADVSAVFSCNYFFEKYIKRRNKWLKDFGRMINEFNVVIDIWKKFLTGEPYDIIHPTYYYPYYLKYVPSFVKRKSKLIITVHDLICEMFYPENEDIEDRRDIINKADGIIAISNKTKEDLLRIYPEISQEKVKVIYHGNFMRKPSKHCTIHFPDEYILVVGNRTEYKNVKIVFEAFKEIKKDRRNLFLVCVGGGEFARKEIEFLRKLDIYKYTVHMSLDDEELYYAYKNAKCFIFPSLYEGFGLPILEAFFCECPAILSDASCFPEIASDAALYFDPYDASDLVKKIETIFRDEKIVSELVKKGKNRLERFSLEQTEMKTLEFYKSIVQRM